MKIIFSSEVAFGDDKTGRIVEITDPERFDKLKDESESISEWAHWEPGLKTMKLTGGHIELKFDRLRRKLMCTIIYETPLLLSKEELEQVADYTYGQLTDGVGENYSQQLADQYGIGFSLVESAEKLKMTLLF